MSGFKINTIHPELRSFLPGLEEIIANGPALSSETLSELRGFLDGMTPPPLPEPGWREISFTNPELGSEVRLYAVNATAERRRPAIVYVHGGGFVAGTAKGSLLECQMLASELDCAVFSIDYPLAPEATYQNSVADSYAALAWVFSNAEALGVDTARVAIMGESAGGGLAALLALRARHSDAFQLAAQILIYPMLDDRTGTSRAPARHLNQGLWDAQKNKFGWTSFLGQPAGTDTVPSEAVPARHEDLSGLPPTFIGVGSADLFIGEDLEFGNALIQAGVLTEIVVVPGALHGFDKFAAGTAVAREFHQTVCRAIRRAFADAEPGAAAGS